MKFLPAERMHTEFPWPLWALGWLAVFKAILWVAYEPVLPEPVLRVVGWKYLLEALPLVICGIALWRRRRWAAWGLTLLAAADLALFGLLPQSIHAYLVDSEVFVFSILLSGVMLICGGPVGDILMLCGAVSMFRNTVPADRPSA